VQPIEPPDLFHLEAVSGWLGLNCAADARLELAKISAVNRNHPGTLETHWLICAHEKNWAEALTVAEQELQSAATDASGWLHRAYALRRVNGGGLLAAWNALLPAAEKFPDEPVIAYNLACYACQMQKLDTAREWLQSAMTIGKKEAIRKMALADEDLKAMWSEIPNF
jgi:Flp pilus assembly protein TadD